MTLGTLGTSWRTNLMSIITGVATALLGIPIFINAITDWSNHKPVDWRSVLVATAFAAITAGLALAKDAKVTGGTIDAGVRPTPQNTAEAKAKVAEGKTP